MLPIGHVLAGTYRITKLLGQGGMACVYEATQVRLPMRFAVKVITGSISSDPEFLRRFRQEAEILARLRHAHVVHVVDWNCTEQGQPYLVMELMEGEDLAHRIRRTGALSLDEALPIFLQIGDALQAAHDQGVIHRDLKPANVFLIRDGAFPNYAKVLDFGIAKSIAAPAALRTKNTGLLGTPAYMAPEQARGAIDAATVRSDQFALALLLHEMLSGRSAFSVPGDDLLQTLTRVLLDDPPALPYPQIEHALRRALSKAPEARFPSIRDFIAATGALESSIIKPLFAHTRPLPLIADEPPELASAYSARRLGDGGGEPADVLASIHEQPTIQTGWIPQAAPEPEAVLPAGPPPGLTAAAFPAGHSPSLSRPSITGQKMTPPIPARWPRPVLAVLFAVPICVVGGLVLVTWIDATAAAWGTASIDQASPTELGEPHPRGAGEPPDLAVSGDETDAVAEPSAPPAVAGAADSIAPAAPPVAAPLQTSASPALTTALRRKPRPVQRVKSPAVASRAAAAPPTAWVLTASAPRSLTAAQRDFLIKCGQQLPASARAAIAAQPLELFRTGGGQLVVTSDQLSAADGAQVELCLRSMNDQMDVPSRAFLLIVQNKP